MKPSYRVRYRRLGGHVHAHFWSSEFGNETAHGKNGELIFRIGDDWNGFLALLNIARELSQIAHLTLIDETPDDEGEAGR